MNLEFKREELIKLLEQQASNQEHDEKYFMDLLGITDYYKMAECLKDSKLEDMRSLDMKMNWCRQAHDLARRLRFISKYLPDQIKIIISLDEAKSLGIV